MNTKKNCCRVVLLLLGFGGVSDIVISRCVLEEERKY